MRASILFLVLLQLIYVGCQPNKVTFSDATCFTNVNTIDAKNGLQENQTVVIQNNKIIKVIASDQIQLAEDNNIVDAKGKFMIPGLWDTHVHFAYIEELAPSMFDLFLAYGITSVRDTGGKINEVKKWKEKADADPKNTPRVKIAGPLMDGIPNVYDGSPGRPELSVGLSGVEACIDMVDQLHADGVDLLKAYEMLSPEQFAAITKRGREKNLKTTGHVPLSMDVMAAVDAGLNSMEHFRNLEFSTAKDWKELLELRRKLLVEGKMDQGGVLRSRIHEAQRIHAIENQDPEQTKKVLAHLAANNVWQIPTLSIMTLRNNNPFLQPAWMDSFKYLPANVESKWREGAELIMKSELKPDRKLFAEWLHKMVDEANKAQVPIMAGTDCPIGYLTPGLSLHDELKLLRKSGMTEMEILASATSGPATYFDMQDELGFIAEGMIADLLILDANPLEDITNTQKINSVIKDGNVLDRSLLDNIFLRLDQVN